MTETVLTDPAAQRCRDAARSWRDLAAMSTGDVAGWVTFAEREALFQRARTLRSGQHYVEIGIFGGCTTAIFATMAPDGVRITAIDDFSNDTQERQQAQTPDVYVPDLRTLCLRNLIAAGVRDRVRLIERSSHDVGPEWTEPIDLLFVDGDHSYAGALADLQEFGAWVVPGGTVLLDDYNMREVRQAATDFLVQHPEYRLTHAYVDQEQGKIATLTRIA